MKFKIYNPVEPFVVLQPFGVNGEYYRSHGINILGHNGLDLQAYHGQPVYAAHDGLALYQVDSGQGHGVVVITKDSYEYEDRLTPFKTIYWHLCSASMDGGKFQSPIANKGALEVKKGDLLGYADSTGFSTGDHLHFAVKPLAKVGENLYTWGPLNADNGYNGCVDPMPYFANANLPDEKEELKAKIEFAQLALIKVLSKYAGYLKDLIKQKSG
jgi:murein DD-endopeptidase MepM/ murein hydrolase activator NlpD